MCNYLTPVILITESKEPEDRIYSEEFPSSKEKEQGYLINTPFSNITENLIKLHVAYIYQTNFPASDRLALSRSLSSLCMCTYYTT